MNNFVDLISIGGMWTAQIMYVLMYLPQIFTNYKQKSGRGFSELMLLGYFNGLTALLFYVFLCNLPLVYKLSASLQMVAVVILVAQRFYYDDVKVIKPYCFLYGANTLSSLLFIPLCTHAYLNIGWYAGWIMLLIFAVNQLPQVVKIFRQKSVAGFSIFFVTLALSAALIEFSTAIMFNLPAQTLLSALRGVVIGTIWLTQFWLYR
jgi:uncharacterized protein with PQ loop repeat